MITNCLFHMEHRLVCIAAKGFGLVRSLHTTTRLLLLSAQKQQLKMASDKVQANEPETEAPVVPAQTSREMRGDDENHT